VSDEADRLVENEITRGQHHRSKQKANAARRKGRDIQIKELTTKLDIAKRAMQKEIDCEDEYPLIFIREALDELGDKNDH